MCKIYNELTVNLPLLPANMGHLLYTGHKRKYQTTSHHIHDTFLVQADMVCHHHAPSLLDVYMTANHMVVFF